MFIEKMYIQYIKETYLKNYSVFRTRLSVKFPAVYKDVSEVNVNKM
jgi:hypothetical protein